MPGGGHLFDPSGDRDHARRATPRLRREPRELPDPGPGAAAAGAGAGLWFVSAIGGSIRGAVLALSRRARRR